MTAFEFTRSAPGSSRGTGEASRPTYCAVAGLAGSLTGGGDQAGPVLGVAFGAFTIKAR